MKRTLMILSIFTFTITAQAAPVQVSTGTKTFETFDGILSNDVNAAEKALRIHMEDSMGCSNVRLNLNILKEDGFFSHGEFSLDLTANCDNHISHLKLDFDPLCSYENEGEAAMVLQYIQSGRAVLKRLIVRGSQSCQE